MLVTIHRESPIEPRMLHGRIACTAARGKKSAGLGSVGCAGKWDKGKMRYDGFHGVALDNMIRCN
jgi:hypothetical protein